MSLLKTVRGEGNQGPYSQVVVHGDLVFTSGQIPLDAATGQVVEGNIEAQSKQALENLRLVLGLGGASVDRVIKVTVFLTDMADFAVMNQVYQDFFGTHRPARSCVQVAALPRGVKIEVEAVAALAN